MNFNLPDRRSIANALTSPSGILSTLSIRSFTAYKYRPFGCVVSHEGFGVSAASSGSLSRPDPVSRRET